MEFLILIFSCHITANFTVTETEATPVVSPPTQLTVEPPAEDAQHEEEAAKADSEEVPGMPLEEGVEEEAEVEGEGAEPTEASEPGEPTEPTEPTEPAEPAE